ncbi:Hpt domain-containing protein [Daejeonella sp.]|jgi:HPt (histidine-containing phosphotransfer) domain-containing protein|uniref:Hpt domain-containing protein n=1 Tax=Daejeonella sp. TaxID=2805397 RepID=UPI0037C01EA0
MSKDSSNNNADFELDLSYLRGIASGSTEFMIDIINLFLSQIPDYFEELDRFIIDKNWADAAEMAHKIKPSLTFMGVQSAMESMAEIEMNARNLENLDAIPPSFKILKDMSKTLFVKLAIIKSDLEKSV